MGVINQELTDPRWLSVWAQVKAAAEVCIQKQDLGTLDIQKMVKPIFWRARRRGARKRRSALAHVRGELLGV